LHHSLIKISCRICEIMTLCYIYGTPNSQKWAKHGFTVVKLSLSIVNHNLRTVNYS
jgi:hypothetical protein